MKMKTDINDPWRGADTRSVGDKSNDCFEDSFLDQKINVGPVEDQRLSDSEQYLQKLYSRLKVLQGSSTKKDLITSLSVVKEDCIARLITSGYKPQSEEEAELASNPVIRHIAPHLQALTASELIHLLKADVLQVTTEAGQEQDTTEDSKINQLSSGYKLKENN